MGINSFRGNENLDRISSSGVSLGESFDSKEYSQKSAQIQEKVEEQKTQQLEEAYRLKQKLLIQDTVEKEKTRLDKLHEAILKLDVSDKNNEGYSTLEEILNDSDKSTEDKLELMVKIIHSMNDEIDVKYENNSTEHITFTCGNRALFFNYLFNNHNDKLQIDKSNICLPYGHCMNVIEIGRQTYLVDGGAGCFNKIDSCSREKKGSWRCIKLDKPIETYEGSGTFYPFSSFPYTERLNKDDLELYTSFNLQGYSYYFTDKLYKAAQKVHPDIKDKDGLKKFFNDEYLSKLDNPLKGILDEGDSLAIDSRENQISILKKQIEKSLSYEENKEKFDNMNEYMKMITKNFSDLGPKEREGENGPLRQFHKADKESMDALKIPKEMIPKILEALTKKVGSANDIEKLSNYLINQFRKYKSNRYEKILDDPQLDSIVKNFINAIDKKASQLNKDLKDYLPTYLSSLLKA